MAKKTWIAMLGVVAAATAVLAAPAAHAGNASVHVQIGAPLPYYAPVYNSYPAYPAYGYGAPRYVAPSAYYHGGRHVHRRDSDRDGIPNRYDRDRDGDGVPNRVDRRPANPWRY